MSASTGAFSIFLHCRSSDCSRRSSICISPLPQQCLFPQEPVFLLPSHLYFSDAAAVSVPAGAFMSLVPSATAVSAPAGAKTLFSKATAVPLLQATSSTPPTLSFASFGGVINAPLWLVSHANCVFWGERTGSGLNAELVPLSPDRGSTPGSGVITKLVDLFLDSMPNTHNLCSVYYM